MYNIKDAIEDIQKANPNADMKTIEEALINTIQNEILPNILINIALPKGPSPGQLKILEFRSRRGGIRVKERFEKLQKNINLLKNLEYVKAKLEYIKYINSSQEYYFYNGSGNQFYTFAHPDFIGKTDYGDPFALLDETREYMRPRLISEISKSFLKIDIMESIIGKIKEEPVFKSFIKIVETSLRRTKYEYEISNININELRDYEIPSWSKIIINLTSKTDDFDESITIWDSIQKHVRDDLISKTKELSEDEKELFNIYLKNLYFHMELPEE